MKKKIIKILTSIFAFVIMLGFVVVPLNVKTANASTLATYESFKITTDVVFTNFKDLKNRVAGSEGEFKTAKYIHNYITAETSFIPKNDDRVKEGYQEFTFESYFSGLYETSQNLVFVYESSKQTNKKVIIGAHYDAVAYEDESYHTVDDIVECESINGSAGNVALLLALAKHIPSWNLDFDVELVFFGAGESNFAGSKYYTEGISAKEKKNILAMLNFDGVALGKTEYYYVDEISSRLSKLVGGAISDNKLQTKEIDIAKLNKIIDVNDELGLGYTHVALASNHVNFKKLGINTINFFAGDYNTGITMGRCEYSGSEILRYTENDNLEYIKTNIGENVVTDNLYEVFKTVNATLTDSDFVSVAGKGNENDWFYTVFANDNLALYLTVVVFVLFVVIAMFVHYKLTVRAYYSNVELEFLSSVVKISEQIDEKGTDMNVPKIVSQVIANDIKKDKTIKRSKKDKKNDEE